MSTQEEKHENKGCLLLFFVTIFPSIILAIAAENSSGINTLLITCITHLVVLSAFHGLVILSLPFIAYKWLFKKKDEAEWDETKWEKKRIWVVFPISAAIFYLGSLLFSGTSYDAYSYTIVGLIFAGMIYWLTKNDYFSPTDYL